MTQGHATGNTAQAASSHFSLSQHSAGNGLTVAGETSAEAAVRVVRFDPQTAHWQNLSLLLPPGLSPSPAPPPAPPAPSPVPNTGLPTAGLAIQLEVASLLEQNMKTGEAIANWPTTQRSSSSSAAVTFSQPIRAHQPTFFHPSVSHAAAGGAWVKFNGSSSLSAALPLAAAKTIVTVARPGPDAGVCCNALVCTYQQHATTPVARDNSTNGLAVKKAGAAVNLVVDYDGENDRGSSDLSTRAVILSVRYNDTHAVGRVSGCDEVSIPMDWARPADTVALGSRPSDPLYLSSRYFDGLVAEVLVYNRSLSVNELIAAEEHLTHKYSQLPAPTPTAQCAAPPSTAAAEGVGGVINLQKERDAVFFSFEADPSVARQRETPQQTFAAAVARVERVQKRVVVETPDVYMNAGIPCAGSAVDGLWRDQPPVFVHGQLLIPQSKPFARFSIVELLVHLRRSSQKWQSSN